MASDRPHGRFLAGEAADLTGVPGTTIGQWARRGLIRASRSTADPHVYSLEDVVEAAVVHALLERGLSHAVIHDTIAALHDYGSWPLTGAPLATTDERPPRIVLREAGGASVLSGRGWQRLAVVPALRELRVPAAPAELVALPARAPDGIGASSSAA